MKKFLLFILIVSIGLHINAQKQAKLPSNLLDKTEKISPTISGEEFPSIISESNPYVSSKPSKDLGTPIGITYYDLQGNSNHTNRMMVYPDGLIQAVWTFAPNSTANWPDRGTGYNRSTNTGTNWNPGPTGRIEGAFTRTGWPSVNKLTSGAEVVVSHKGDGGNLSKSTDNGLTWENFEVGGATLSLLWTRMTANGNTIHVIGNTTTATPYQGFTLGALVYLRSTDGGTNWSAPIIPTGLDTSNYPTHNGVNSIFGDEYDMTCNGNNIAIVVGSAYATPALVKSTNNGDTWSYKEILHLPIKKFLSDGTKIYDINLDNQQDNCYASDASNFVTLDNNGKAHVFFGRMKYTSDGAAGNFFPYTDGLYYWNEDMGTISYQYKWTMIGTTNTYEGIPDTVNFPIITEVYDINHNGIMDLPPNGAGYQMGYYRTSSLSSQPSAVIAPEGSLTLFYSSIVEGTDGVVGADHWAYRNVWEIHKIAGSPNNFIWSVPKRIAEDDYTEQVWPCTAPAITGTIPNCYAHLWYQGDGLPGHSLQSWGTTNPHTIVENTIYYRKDTAFSEVGINEINPVNSEVVVYPNPASETITIAFNLIQDSKLTVSIYNVVGQLILAENKNLSTGETSIQLNVQYLPSGLYYIKTNAGDQTFINKIVLK